MRDIGFCIYCGSKEPPLTREHVLPRGLGGNEAPTGRSQALVLRNATCEECREITRGVEETCLLGPLLPIRRVLGLTRKDRRKPTSPILVRHADGRETTEELPDQHLIGAMIIPAFRGASRFIDATPDDLGIDYKVMFPEAARFPEGAASVGVELRCDPAAFARMLAKIALGWAVLEVGLDTFIPTVRGLIRGTDLDFHRHVGGFCDELPEPPKTDGLHTLSIRQHDCYLLVDIQLFSQHGGPINYVVVGLLREQFVISRIQSNRALRLRLR